MEPHHQIALTFFRPLGSCFTRSTAASAAATACADAWGGGEIRGPACLGQGFLCTAAASYEVLSRQRAEPDSWVQQRR